MDDIMEQNDTIKREVFEKIFSNLSYVYLNNQTYRYISDFTEALKTRSNKIIESTIVYKALDLLLSGASSAFSNTISKGDEFYRARELNIEKVEQEDWGLVMPQNNIFEGFDEYNSKEPPIGVSPNGRNNILGASYLYLAEDELTAISETVSRPNTFVSVAKFRVRKKMRLVDFSKDSTTKKLDKFQKKHQFNASLLITLIMQRYSTPVVNPEMYIASQYISDIVRKMGYDGVKYKSSKTEMFCVTIFNCHKSFIKFEESKLMYCGTILPFAYDINSENCITTCPKSLQKKDFENITKTARKVIEKNLDSLKINNNNGK